MAELIDMAYSNSKRNEASYQYNKYDYSNKDAVENVINYITRNRRNESRRNELIEIGGEGVPCFGVVEDMIKYFLMVQNFHGINRRAGRRVKHIVLSFSDYDFTNLEYSLYRISCISRDICKIFFNLGFQVVYAIHHDPQKKIHTHFVINTINYKTGMKLHMSFVDFKEIQTYADSIIEKYYTNASADKYSVFIPI